MIPYEALKPGSKWVKTNSDKVYEVVNLAIDSTTSGVVVVYKRGDKWCTRPIGEFLGDVRVKSGEMVGEYRSRFLPHFRQPGAQ